MNIAKIFSSLQGEGKYSGTPTTFIRLAGCPFACSYCDTPNLKGKFYSFNRIITEVNKLKNKHICITGGEPLIQEETLSLVYELLSYSYIVSIETSGLVEIDSTSYNRAFSYCMDIKTPCSGMENENKYENLSKLKSYDEVKFVVSDSKDIEFTKKVLKKYPTKASILYSPLDNNINLAREIALRLTNGELKGKLNLQIHKILDIA